MKTPKRTILVDHLKCGPLKSVGFFKPKYIQEYETSKGIVREITTSGKLPEYKLVVPKRFGRTSESVNVIIE
jgi:hypothetical protein